MTNTGPGFNQGPGAAPGGVASKNGRGHMRVRGGPFPIAVSVCVRVCVSGVAAKVAVAHSENVSAFAAASRGMNSAASGVPFFWISREEWERSMKF